MTILRYTLFMLDLFLLSYYCVLMYGIGLLGLTVVINNLLPSFYNFSIWKIYFYIKNKKEIRRRRKSVLFAESLTKIHLHAVIVMLINHDLDHSMHSIPSFVPTRRHTKYHHIRCQPMDFVIALNLYHVAHSNRFVNQELIVLFSLVPSL